MTKRQTKLTSSDFDDLQNPTTEDIKTCLAGLGSGCFAILDSIFETDGPYDYNYIQKSVNLE